MPEDLFRKVCERKDIPKQGIRNFKLEGKEIAILDTPAGLVARSGVCKHNGFKLELCERKGDTIRCPRHGWEYRISDGSGIKPVWTQLNCYPVELRGAEIWVRLAPVEEDPPGYDTSTYKW